MVFGWFRKSRPPSTIEISPAEARAASERAMTRTNAVARMEDEHRVGGLLDKVLKYRSGLGDDYVRSGYLDDVHIHENNRNRTNKLDDDGRRRANDGPRDRCEIVKVSMGEFARNPELLSQEMYSVCSSDRARHKGLGLEYLIDVIKSIRRDTVRMEGPGFQYWSDEHVSPNKRRTDTWTPQVYLAIDRRLSNGSPSWDPKMHHGLQGFLIGTQTGKIETLCVRHMSTCSGAGPMLVKAFEDDWGQHGVKLSSVETPETLAFYSKLGFKASHNNNNNNGLVPHVKGRPSRSLLQLLPDAPINRVMAGLDRDNTRRFAQAVATTHALRHQITGSKRRWNETLSPRNREEYDVLDRRAWLEKERALREERAAWAASENRRQRKKRRSSFAPETPDAPDATISRMVRRKE